MTLFEQFNFVRFIFNKDNTGNVIKPEDFKAAAPVANLELFKIKMGLPEDYAPGQPVPRQSPDISKILTVETIFLKEYESAQAVAGGLISFPANFFMVDTIRFGYQRTVDGQVKTYYKPVEELTEREYSDRAGSYIKEPTQQYPVYVMRSGGIYVYPITITQVQFSYLRFPVAPVFDYVSASGVITEGLAPVEYEWPRHLHNTLTMLICRYFDLHIGEQDVLNYAEMYKKQGV